MPGPQPKIDLDPEPYIVAYRAACRAGIPPHDVAAVIHRTIRKVTGLPPIKARQWFGHHLLARQSEEFKVVL